MRRIVSLLLFLMLVDEGDATTFYSKSAPEGFLPHGIGPFHWVQHVLFDALPIKIRLFDVILLAVLAVGSTTKGARIPRVGPMRTALLVAAGTIVLWFVYGIATGGDARYASWQVYLLLSAILYAFVVSLVFVTPEHYQSLTKVIVAAAVYRACMCWYVYLAYVHSGAVQPRPDYITGHDDTVLWVITILALLIHALNQKSTMVMVRAGLLTLLFLAAIQWNNRRLAWVSLVMGLIIAFFLLPRGRARSRIVRSALAIAPVLALYVAVGWGRPERIFVPLRSLASVSTQEDKSTMARNAENLGLIHTIHQYNPVTGTGWGHGYIALTDKYSIASVMELWPYIPHNSILGLLTFTGTLGFAGIWLAFPTAVFLNARLAKLGRTEQERNIGFVCATGMIVCANQMYGDMGDFSPRTMYLLATTYAVALRLPVVTGLWPSSRLPVAAGKSVAPASPSASAAPPPHRPVA